MFLLDLVKLISDQAWYMGGRHKNIMLARFWTQREKHTSAFGRNRQWLPGAINKYLIQLSVIGRKYMLQPVLQRRELQILQERTPQSIYYEVQIAECRLSRIANYKV